MEKQIKVIQQIFPLLETIEEAINHMPKQLEEMRYEEYFHMLKDIIAGIETIEQVLIPVKEHLPEIAKPTIKRAKTMLAKSIKEILLDIEAATYSELDKKTEQLKRKYTSYKKLLEKELQATFA